MTMPSTANPARATDGFTLVELVVAMAVSTVVLLATLSAFDAFSTASSRQTAVTDTNDRARSTVDRVVRELRGAAIVLRADETDLIYSVRLSPTLTRTTRLCSPGATGGRLYESRSTSWASGQPLPTACPTPASGAWDTSVLSPRVRPASAGGGLFTYAPQPVAASAIELAKVKSIGFDLALDTSSNGRTSSSTLRASAAMRKTAGASTALSGLGSDDVVIVCPTNAPPRVSLAADVFGLLGPLTVTYAEEGGTTLGSGSNGASVLIRTGVTSVVTTITDALGVTKKITKPVGCS